GAVSPNATYIAKKVKKPIATIHGRLRRLEVRGVIESYTPVVDYRKTGSEIISFILLQAPLGTNLEEFGKNLSKIKEITDVYFLVGEWGFLCKVKAKSMDDYTRIVSMIYSEVRPLKMEDIISPKTFKREI
ncbi:MAG: Lrp/AsnC ligand binding domain-containing protein, partial [archaeon]